jgi:predicted GNAT family N-acyltransferase
MNMRKMARPIVIASWGE